MIAYLKKQRPTLGYRVLSAVIAVTFIFSVILPPGYAQVAPQTVLNLPAAGLMLPVTNSFNPAIIRGITFHPENPLEFDFIVDRGDDKLDGKELGDQALKMIKYFLAALTVPKEEMWVNLSPYEQDRIITKGFGDTEMGRDLLAQDYLLKQLTSSLMYPENELGKKFWERVQTKAMEKFGTTEVPINTFNKVWIVPEKAVVYEHQNSVFVIEQHLKVMLEEDYLALQDSLGNEKYGMGKLGLSDTEVLSGVSSEIVREILIPEIEKEVNEGKIFANLRQIYNSMILAIWYKQNLKESLLGQVYVDQNKTKGVDTKDKQINQKIYDQYMEAFKKGVYDYIKEDYDPAKGKIIPRKYFSGGVTAPERVTGASPHQGRKWLSSSPLENWTSLHVRIVEEGPASSPTAAGLADQVSLSNSTSPIKESEASSPVAKGKRKLWTASWLKPDFDPATSQTVPGMYFADQVEADAGLTSVREGYRRFF